MSRNHLITFLKIIVSAGLIILLTSKLGLKEILSQFKYTNLSWVGFAILIISLSNILGSLQWHLLLRAQNINLPFLRVVGYYYVGLFFNNFLIGYIGGDAVRIYDIRKSSGNSSSAVSAVFLDRFMGFFIITAMALIALLFWQNMLQSKTTLFVILAIFFCWMVSFLFIFHYNLAQKVGRLLRFLMNPRINGKLKEIYLSIHSYRDQKATISVVVIISLVIQFIRIMVHYCAALAVGLEGHLKYFFIFIPIIALIASLPISIGGIGVREGSAVALFSNITGFPPEMVVAMEFLAYVIGVLAALPGGLIFILRKEKPEFNDQTTGGAL
ncbi:MAG: lysylphosphatidylglycerol synthase transmembrane domain-containing protein [bacterium]|nr:lysylphosphatidylglycerol synthase transmembrane domain-containing protein [bacterium]